MYDPVPFHRKSSVTHKVADQWKAEELTNSLIISLKRTIAYCVPRESGVTLFGMFYIPERLKSFDSCLHLGKKFCEKTHTCTTLFWIKYRVRNGHWSHTKFQLWLWNSISPNPLFRLLDRLSETAVFDIIGILSRICCSLVLIQVLYVSCL